MINAIRDCAYSVVKVFLRELGNTFKWGGKLGREDFGRFTVMATIISFGSLMVFNTLGLPVVFFAGQLLLLVPVISTQVRRLRDVGFNWYGITFLVVSQMVTGVIGLIGFAVLHLIGLFAPSDWITKLKGGESQ